MHSITHLNTHYPKSMETLNLSSFVIDLQT